MESMGLEEARDGFAGLVAAVTARRRVMLTRRGVAVAAVVIPADAELLEELEAQGALEDIRERVRVSSHRGRG